MFSSIKLRLESETSFIKTWFLNDILQFGQFSQISGIEYQIYRKSERNMTRAVSKFNDIAMVDILGNLQKCTMTRSLESIVIFPESQNISVLQHIFGHCQQKIKNFREVFLVFLFAIKDLKKTFKKQHNKIENHLKKKSSSYTLSESCHKSWRISSVIQNGQHSIFYSVFWFVT